MTVPELPRLLLDQHFSDIDEYASRVEWELNLLQLDAGPLRSRAALLGTSRAVAMRCEFNRAFHQAGS